MTVKEFLAELKKKDIPDEAELLIEVKENGESDGVYYVVYRVDNVSFSDLPSYVVLEVSYFMGG